MSKPGMAVQMYLNTPNIDNMPNSVIEAFAAGSMDIDAGGILPGRDTRATGLIVRAGDSKPRRAALRPS
ncbi:MAG: hypothetical protein U0163_04610 [Gemmatimonadaceae bacterium]